MTGLIDEWLKKGHLEQVYKTQLSPDYLNNFETHLKALDFWTHSLTPEKQCHSNKLVHFEGLKFHNQQKNYQKHRIDHFDASHSYYPLKQIMLSPFENMVSEKIQKSMI